MKNMVNRSLVVKFSAHESNYNEYMEDTVRHYSNKGFVLVDHEIKIVKVLFWSMVMVTIVFRKE